MTTLFDTSALLAALKPTEPHHKWSISQLNTCKLKGPVVISDIVYCELSVGMAKQADLDAAVTLLAVERLPGSDAVLFRAGKAYEKYKKKRGANKTNVLPDFLIGAAAEVANVPLVTANPKDFVGYFPSLVLIQP